MSGALALQRFVRDLIDANVEMLAGRVFEAQFQKRSQPYASFGPSDWIDEGLSCSLTGSSYLQIDIWTKENGSLSICKTLVDQVKTALRGQSGQVDGVTIHWIRIVGAECRGDPDGITGHGIVDIKALVTE